LDNKSKAIIFISRVRQCVGDSTSAVGAKCPDNEFPEQNGWYEMGESLWRLYQITNKRFQSGHCSVGGPWSPQSNSTPSKNGIKACATF